MIYVQITSYLGGCLLGTGGGAGGEGADAGVSVGVEVYGGGRKG